MKVTKERFPHLFLNFSQWPEPKRTKAPKKSLDEMREITRIASHDIIYVTDPAYDAIVRSQERLWLLKHEVKSAVSTLLYSVDGKGVAIFYSLAVDDANITIAGMVSNLGFFYMQYPKEPGCTKFYPSEIDLNNHRSGAVGQLILCFELFRQYAEVETKHLPPKSKINEGLVCLYNNQSKLPIDIFDSTYFTNLIKSDSFNVRGHFRLQAFGERHGKRKLIWIEEFKKLGYTRKAKIEQTQIH